MKGLTSDELADLTWLAREGAGGLVLPYNQRTQDLRFGLMAAGRVSYMPIVRTDGGTRHCWRITEQGRLALRADAYVRAAEATAPEAPREG